MKTTFLTAALLALLALPVLGELPHPYDVPEINFQGRIEVGDLGYDGKARFRFTIGNSDMSDTYWGPSWAETTVVEGIYNVIIGGDTDQPLDKVDFSLDSDYYLKVEFSNDTDGWEDYETLTPYQEILTVPFAVNADLLDGLDSPDSAFVGLTDVQTLTNKSLTSPTIDTVYFTGYDFGAGDPSDPGFIAYDPVDNTVAYWNGSTWIDWGEGGAGTDPGGSDTHVQYNDGGAFGGEAAFTWNSANDKLTVTSGATTGEALQILVDSLTGGTGLEVTTDSAGFTGDLVHFRANYGRALFIEHTGATGEDGSSVFINRTNNGRALTIEVANTTQHGVWIKSNTLTNGSVMTVKADSPDMTGTGYVLHAFQAHTDAVGHAVVGEQWGSGNAIRGIVAQNAPAGGNAGFFNQAAWSDSTVGTATGGAVHIDNSGNVYWGLTVYSNQTSPQANALVRFEAEGTGFDQDILDIQNDGTGSAIWIDQNGDTGTEFSNATGGALHISNGTVNDGYAITIYSDNNADANTPLVGLLADNANFDQNLLWMRNDGTATALFIAQSGSGAGLEVTSDRGATQTNSLVALNAGLDSFDRPLLELGHDGQDLDGPHLWLHPNAAAPSVEGGAQAGMIYAGAEYLYFHNGTNWIALTGAGGGSGSGTVMGSGSAGTVPRWATESVLEDSIITDDGSTVTVGGILDVGDNDIDNVGDIAVATISADDGSSFTISDNWTNAGNTVADLGTVTTAVIGGGTIDDTVIGGTTPSEGTFTSLTAETAYLGAGATVTEFSTDTTLGGAAAADTLVPTQLAIKSYVDETVGAVRWLDQTFKFEDVDSFDGDAGVFVAGVPIRYSDGGDFWRYGMVVDCTAGDGCGAGPINLAGYPLSVGCDTMQVGNPELLRQVNLISLGNLSAGNDWGPPNIWKLEESYIVQATAKLEHAAAGGDAQISIGVGGATTYLLDSPTYLDLEDTPDPHSSGTNIDADNYNIQYNEKIFVNVESTGVAGQPGSDLLVILDVVTP